ncbi:MAG TPA: transposase, partial [Bryobacteraceae bacterium]|nr:transposase [Bryobacteraceae bacterium]
HIHELGQALFVTWRLRESLPPNRCFAQTVMTSGQAFARMDRLLDQTRHGSFYLRRPAIADMVVEAIRFNAEVLQHYRLHAFVVMPNHVHFLVSPLVPLSRLTKSLKGITAKRANLILGLTGQPFWQEESYDHLVRDPKEFRRIADYIEENPVRAGLVAERSQYAWSSAFVPAGGPAADEGVRPTWQ